MIAQHLQLAEQSFQTRRVGRSVCAQNSVCHELLRVLVARHGSGLVGLLGVAAHTAAIVAARWVLGQPVVARQGRRWRKHTQQLHPDHF